MSVQFEWDMTHLCSRYNDKDCEHFLQTGSKETVLNGKKLDICCYYCTSENKVRKIGSGGTWTGLSPKFCPKRKALEDNRSNINENTEETKMAKFNINAMLSAPAAVMPEQYTQAAQLHAEIINCAKTAQENLYQMAVGFKKMRDEKLYIALGYDNFGDYCEQKAELSRQNVYQYIKVVEKLPKDFVLSTRQIGKEKMYLLSTLSEPEREEIVETTDLESTTVKELKAKIKELEVKTAAAAEEREKMECKVSELAAEAAKADELESRINRLKGENLKLQGRAEKSDKIKEEKERLEQLLKEAERRAKEQPKAQSDPKDKEKIASLEAQVKELESRPIDVVYEKDEEEIKSLKEKIAELQQELEAENGKAESDIKVFAVRLTADDYDKLVSVIGECGNESLKNAVMNAQVLNV